MNIYFIISLYFIICKCPVYILIFLEVALVALALWLHSVLFSLVTFIVLSYFTPKYMYDKTTCEFRVPHSSFCQLFNQNKNIFLKL